MVKQLIPREYAEKNLSEHGQQTAVMMWCALHADKEPLLEYLFAIPNGGSRNYVEAARLKASGVKSGVPDLMLPVSKMGYLGLFIEMKKDRQATIQPNQEMWRKRLIALNYSSVVCYGYFDAIEELRYYFDLNRDKYPD